MVWGRHKFYSHKLGHWFRPIGNHAHLSTAILSMPSQRMAMHQHPWGVYRPLNSQIHRHFVEYRMRANRQWLPTIERCPIAMGNTIGSLTWFFSVFFPEYSVWTNNKMCLENVISPSFIGEVMPENLVLDFFDRWKDRDRNDKQLKIELKNKWSFQLFLHLHLHIWTNCWRQN